MSTTTSVDPSSPRDLLQPAKRRLDDLPGARDVGVLFRLVDARELGSKVPAKVEHPLHVQADGALGDAIEICRHERVGRGRSGVPGV